MSKAAAHPNILQVSPQFAPAWRYGGLVEAVYNLSRVIAAQGASVRVLTTDADGPHESIARAALDAIAKDGGFEVRCCRRLVGNSVSPAMLGAMAAEVKWAGVVHLHAAYSFPTIPALLAARILDRPMVWSPHGALQRWARTRRPRLKAAWEQVCRAVAPRRLAIHSTSAAEASESRARFPDATIFVISNGVDIPESIDHTARCAALRLGYLGRLDEKKGIENLLAAIGLLGERSGPQVMLAIAGAGEPAYEASLRRRIDELGIGGVVTMLGGVRGDDKTRFFANQDVIVVPSYTENFGIVVAEALAHGIPVIASRGTPWAELEVNGCGLWVNNDPASLAESVTRIASERLVEMGLRGRHWMAERYAWTRVGADFLDVYRQMIARTPLAAMALAG
jgi:glycosyltransferase involved in cell wall biosynthesis